MRRLVFAFVLVPVAAACTEDSAPSMNEDTGTSSTTVAADSSTSEAMADETGSSTGEPAPEQNPPAVFYLTEYPHQLRVVGIDGSDDRLLVEHEEFITETRFFAVNDRVVLAHGELPGGPVDEMLYANVDGSVTGVYPDFMPERLWFGPEPTRIWYPYGFDLGSRLLGGSIETFDDGGAPLWFFSRTRRFVGSTHSNGNTRIGDLQQQFETFYVPPARLPECTSDTRPTLWINEAETRLLLFPTHANNLGRFELEDPESAVWLAVGPDFRPLGYDRCADGLVGRSEDGAIIRIGDDGSVVELAPAGPEYPAEFPFEYGFAPNGRRLVALTTDGSRQVHVANLFTLAWSTFELPDGTGTTRIVATGDDHVLIAERSEEGQTTAHRVELSTGTMDSELNCNDTTLDMTADGSLMLCEAGTTGITIGIQEPEGTWLPLVSDARDGRLAPSTTQIEARCMDTEPAAELGGCW